MASEEFTVYAHSFEEAIHKAQEEACTIGPYYDRRFREVEFVTVRLSNNGRVWVFKAEPWGADHGKP
jgi:hypothetical protein